MRALVAAVALLWATVAGAEERWVTLGGLVTETVFALGLGERVVGVDGSSVYPAAVEGLPRVGQHAAVAVDAVLALRPTAVIASDRIGPPEALAQLRAMGIPVEVVDSPESMDEVRAALRQVAARGGVPARGEALVARLDGALAGVRPAASRPKVAFLYARGAGTLLLAGADTGVAAVIGAAGGVVPPGWSGFRPITAEAVVASDPDVWLVTTGGLASVGGVEGLLALPGVALTAGGRARRVVALDDGLLLTMGPRVGEAAAALAAALQGAR